MKHRIQFLRRRREFLALLGGAAVAWPLAASRAAPREAANHRILGRDHAFGRECGLGRRGRRTQPSSELRARGPCQGAAAQQLMDGDGQALGFADGTFDLVCAFGVQHHVPRPRKAVGEMLRGSPVARCLSPIRTISGKGARWCGSPSNRFMSSGCGHWPTSSKRRQRVYNLGRGRSLL
jgi:SAM-dependent methyltransferase